MTVEIRPTWDPSGTVSVCVSAERRQLVLCAEGELRQFELVEERAERLGWVERELEDGLVCRRRVSVGEVMCACLREWEAEQAVVEVTQRAVARAKQRGGCWQAAGERLEGQLRSARCAARVSAVPFRVLFRHRSDPRQERAMSVSEAAERVGYLTVEGKPDTQRLRRRLGLAHHSDAQGPRFQRAVGYRTGLALCQAIDVDPVELGL
ncbi:MAG: hypothetical protein M3433_03200 [Actinomycetota bacterium]|nr:hypothetical protein [Actinomycetota bacterium]